MKVRAAVLQRLGAPAPYAQSRPLEIEEVELAPPGPGEVLVRIAAAGLCHSDLSILNGDRPRRTPIVLGHEAAGVVEALGEGVTDLAPGDHVILVFVPSCGHCAPCAEGRPALCEPGGAANVAGTLLGGARRLSYRGEPMDHFVGVSAFAEYATVSRRSLHKIDRELPLEIAAMFGCAVVTGVGAVVNTSQVRPGQTVAVVGLGGVGLAALMGALAAGAARVIAVDLAQDKLDFALALGATDSVNASDPDAAKRLRDMTEGGVDHALEMVGSAKALEFAYKVTRRGGTTVTVGLPAAIQTLNTPVWHLVAEERTLKGSYLGSCVPRRDLGRFIALYRQGKLPVDRLLTGRLKLEEINEGFDRLQRGEAIRQIVTMP
ncbi:MULTISPECIES: zinc-dependent alcohol dehydrogenase family protein [Variovorax]|uniref:Alcohol dehydrogenase n=1 Tax=Variovorax boronicumulans TaxID=436515 RepID=A0AAW8E6S5_9BURK|nr:zinc-dependent alcohol dehydrogenase family protein [Variovorax boronicumulans]MDP9881831.1 alcohol dehydrogenase [Variovorax boronicumulans]MDP9913712.1 alcohol dehydrogenase [Variovorax boronicumulans]MDP9919124.1 alcohol dehydrogenase [Variovorax boronicumulans]MDP9927290.1 alcohol dehydrogenase [Variovorax boronicumulans]OEZ27622.1 alcohol dehydrogenase [Variovorax boronicumulans]